MQEIYNKDREFDPSFNFIGNEFEFNPTENTKSVTKEPDYPHWLELSAQLTEYKQKLENTQSELNLVSSFLYAILHELDATHNLTATVLAAERNGKRDGIKTWWMARKSQDIQRLKTELNKHFSPQEIELLKKSLVGGDI
jgi:glutamine synthetase type III